MTRLLLAVTLSLLAWDITVPTQVQADSLAETCAKYPGLAGCQADAKLSSCEKYPDLAGCQADAKLSTCEKYPDLAGCQADTKLSTCEKFPDLAGCINDVTKERKKSSETTVTRQPSANESTRERKAQDTGRNSTPVHTIEREKTAPGPTTTSETPQAQKENNGTTTPSTKPPVKTIPRSTSSIERAKKLIDPLFSDSTATRSDPIITLPGETDNEQSVTDDRELDCAELSRLNAEDEQLIEKSEEIYQREIANESKKQDETLDQLSLTIFQLKKQQEPYLQELNQLRNQPDNLPSAVDVDFMKKRENALLNTIGSLDALIDIAEREKESFMKTYVRFDTLNTFIPKEAEVIDAKRRSLQERRIILEKRCDKKNSGATQVRTSGKNNTRQPPPVINKPTSINSDTDPVSLFPPSVRELEGTTRIDILHEETAKKQKKNSSENQNSSIKIYHQNHPGPREAHTKTPSDSDYIDLSPIEPK